MNDMNNTLKEQMIQELSALVAIPSVTDDRGACSRALEQVLDLARSLGLEARSVCDGQVGEIEIGEGDETVAVLVHLDVVPPGIPENWATDPFTLTRKDGTMFGRGVHDDKGPLIACLFAMAALQDYGRQPAAAQPLRKKLRMIIGTREETDWEDIYQYTREHSLPDYGFTPDGDFPICIAEKGILELDFFVPYAPGLCDGWHLTAIESGTMNNTVPGRASCQMSLYRNGQVTETRTLQSAGKSIHSGEPESGENAIWPLIDQIEAMEPAGSGAVGTGPAPSSAPEALRLLREKFADPWGSPLGIENESEYYQGEYVGKNTICVTRLERKGEDLWFHVDIRYTCGTDPKALQQILTEQVQPLGGRVTEFIDMPPAFVRSDRSFIRILQEAYREHTGNDAPCLSSTGGTYAQAMPNIVTFGPTFPDKEDPCHEENEFMTEDCLMQIYEIYLTALQKLSASEEPLR